MNRIDPSGLQQGIPGYPPGYQPECYEPIAPGDIRPVNCILPPDCYRPVDDIYPGYCYLNQPPSPPLPSIGNPSPPLPPSQGGCPVSNPKTLKPVRVRLPYPGIGIQTELILFPPGTSHVFQPNINMSFAGTLAWAGFAADIGELATMLVPQLPTLPDTVAIGDIIITASASYYSGETYLYQQIHPSLPPMTVVGQDVIFTSSDAGAALLAKTILPAIGFESGGIPGGMIGYVGGQAVDVGTTIASIVYDGGRLSGVPTRYSYAVLWEWPLTQAILIHARED